MYFGVLGDIHGDFDALDTVMARHRDVTFWLSAGDVASDDLQYRAPAAPLYWIQGNNEDFDRIAAARAAAPSAGAVPVLKNLFLLPNGTRTTIEGVSVGALGGTFAPTRYETPEADLPWPGKAKASPYQGASASREQSASASREQSASASREQSASASREQSASASREQSASASREQSASASRDESASVGQGFSPARLRDDKRRHFVHEQVAALQGAGHVDVLLTHEAPRPFIVQVGTRRNDAGKTPINELLTALRPRLHFFGHHHRFTDTVRSGVRSIGLDLVSESYVLVDAETFEPVRCSLLTL